MLVEQFVQHINFNLACELIAVINYENIHF